jgi:hypothetical protein
MRIQLFLVLHHGKTQAQGKPAKECSGTTVGTEVSGLQLYERRHTKTADCAESGGPVQGAGTGTNESDARSEHGTNGRGAIPVS